jgi:hypothetical protein
LDAVQERVLGEVREPDAGQEQVLERDAVQELELDEVLV